MVYGLNVVSVGIQHKRRVVAWVVGTLAGTPIVASASSQGRHMKLVDRRPFTGLKRQVNMRHGSTSLVHKQFIRIEAVSAFNERGGDIERFKNRAIKTLACLESDTRR